MLVSKAMNVTRLLLVAPPVVLLATGCGRPPAPENRGDVPSVEVVAAREGSLPRGERLNGVVRARNQVEVRAEVEAVVEQVLVETGAAVSAGQPLVRLRASDLRDQLAQAEAAVRLQDAALREAQARTRELQSQVSRTRQLSEEKLVSAAEREAQEAQLAASEAAADVARARVEQARALARERRDTLGRMVVRSPVAGHVGRRQVEPGQLVGADQVLFEVGDLRQLRIEVPLTEAMLRDVKAGQPVVVTSGSLDEPLHATLSRVSPFLARDSFSTTGEIDVVNPGLRLRPGHFVAVDVMQGEGDRSTLVPASALWEDPEDGARYVFVVKVPAASPPGDAVSETAHAVEARAVEVRGERGGTAGVTAVAPGDWVIVAGQHLVGRDAGAKARVRRSSWERVISLQGRQREDILRDFMAKQQRLAATQGAAPPTTDEVRRAAREQAR